MKRLMMMVAALTAAALVAPTLAQSQAEHDLHHPSDSAKSDPAPANPPPAASQPGMGGMQKMGMMKDMKNMVGNMSMMNTTAMMQTMGMMGPGMGGIATIDRVEGRIAFLRTEIKITDAQASAWNGFADALRTNAGKLAEVRASMMPKPDEEQQPASTMAERLDLQEKWLLARLDGTRAMKSAFTKLNEVLSDEQKKAANDLLAPHMGMGMMAMMASQMPPGQAQPGQMQPGQMGSGQMHPGQMGPGRMQPGQMQPPGTGNK